MTTSNARRRNEADLVLLELVRLTSSQSWTLERAADRLLSKHHNPGALRVALKRVHRVRAERASPIADRAAVTLSTVLARLDHQAATGYRA